MRFLLIVVILAGAFWSGHWVVGSHRESNGLRGWLDTRAAQGWQVRYSGLRTRGFPNRFDTTIDDPDVAVDTLEFGWSAPFLQLFRLSYRPDHYIVVWPGEQTLTLARQRFEVSTRSARSSVVFRPGGDFRPDHANLVFDQIGLRANSGVAATAEKVLLAMRPAAETGLYEFGLDITGLRYRAEAVPARTTTDEIRADAVVGLARPLGRDWLNRGIPAIATIGLKSLRISWGRIRLEAEGILAADRTGRLSGQVTIRARKWQKVVDQMKSAGWITDNQAETLQTALPPTAPQTGTADPIIAQLTIEAGVVTIGETTLGQLPALPAR